MSSIILYIDVLDHIVSINDYMFNVFAICNPYNVYKWYNNIIFVIENNFLAKIKYQLAIN